MQVGSRRLGFVDFALVLPNPAWDSWNWAEMAKQLGKNEEIKTQIQQNVVSDHHGHPVLALARKRPKCNERRGMQ